MKTALLINSFWSQNKIISGGDIRVLEISKRNFNNEETIILTSNKGKNYLEKELNKLNFIITPDFFDKFTIIPSYILRTFLATNKLKKTGPSIIYSSSDFFPDVIPAYFNKNKDNKWVQTVFHIYPNWRTRPGNKIINFVGYYLQKLSFYLIKKKADKIITINNQVKDELIKKGFNKDKIYVSSCACNIDYFNKVKKSKTGYDGIFLARLNYSKGIFDLIEIWKNVCKISPQARLGIIGGGSDAIKNELLIKINKAGLKDNIDLLGYLENDKAFSTLKSSKIFLFPSHEEGWGIAIAETMACKIPVVSWDLSVYKEVFEKYTIQIKENDINKFANKVVELLKDNKKRITLGNEGFKFIQKYSWNNVAKNELKIIRGDKK